MNRLLLTAVAITLLIFGLGLLLLAALSRHKKSATGPLALVGARGRVQNTLAPEGAVIIKGELWPARSRNNQTLPANTTIRVTGAAGHLLEVEAADEKRQF